MKRTTMSNSEAAELLVTLKNTMPIGGKTAEAIDRAIEVLEPTVKPTINGIIEAVCAETGVTREELITPSHIREYAESRWMVMWLCRYYTSYTLTTISRSLGCRSHVTTMHGINKGDTYMAKPNHNPTWVSHVKTIIRQIERSYD